MPRFATLLNSVRLDSVRRLLRQTLPVRHAFAALVSVGALAAGEVSLLAADGYQPITQRIPPGIAGQWAAVTKPDCVNYMQPVSVELPTGGQIGLYSSPDSTAVTSPAPAAVRLQVGRVYRLQLSSLDGYPGVELYPSVELIDRLHPPAGKADDFPVPITFTLDELEAAIEGKLVTKIIYLEQPDSATANPRPDRAPTDTPPLPGEDAYAFASRSGRPMAIIRLGGRQPDAGSVKTGFYGDGSPIEWIGTRDAEDNEDNYDVPPKNSRSRRRKPAVTPVATTELNRPSTRNASPPSKTSRAAAVRGQSPANSTSNAKSSGRPTPSTPVPFR
jgi:hypothetical protein